MAVSRGKRKLNDEDRRVLALYLSPLEQMRARLEMESSSSEEGVRCLAHECLTLLNVFATEPAQAHYFNNYMLICDLYGLVSKYRCPTCDDYESWFYCIDHTCEHCNHRLELGER